MNWGVGIHNVSARPLAMVLTSIIACVYGTVNVPTRLSLSTYMLLRRLQIREST